MASPRMRGRFLWRVEAVRVLRLDEVDVELSVSLEFERGGHRGASRPRCLCRLDVGDERDQRIYRPVAERDCAPLDRLHTTSPITVAKASWRR
jgi:hypothetical protein